MKDALMQHIEVTSGITGGKPHIAGHRITVQDIVIWHERIGKSADEIASEHGLTLSDICHVPGNRDHFIPRYSRPPFS